MKLRVATEANEDWNNSVTDATTAEDYFNLALQECSNETERTNLVLQAMEDQGLSTIAQKWRENNEALVENNEANAQLQEQMGDLGETLMPITTILTEMLTKALSWFNGLDTGTQKFIVSAVLLSAVLMPIVSIGKNLLGGLGSIVNMDSGLSSMLTGAISGFSGLGIAMSGLEFGVLAASILAIGGSLLWLANNADAVKTVVSEDMEALNAMAAEHQAERIAQYEAEHAASVAKVADWNATRAAAKEIQDAMVADERAAKDAKISEWSATLAAAKEIQSTMVADEQVARAAQIVNWQNFFADVSTGMSGFWDSLVSDYQTGNEAILAESHAAHVAQVSNTQSMMSNLLATCSTGLNSMISTYKKGNSAILAETHANHVSQVSKWQILMSNMKTSIASGLERIKSLFNFEWSLPRIKLPHFHVSGSFSLNPPAVPSFGVSWYAKGAILNGARIFGALGNKLLGGGEAGPEAVLPLSGFYSELRNILASFIGSPAEQIDMTALYSRLDGIYDRLGRLQVVLDTGVLVGETVDQYDAALAERQTLAARGV